MEESQKSDYDMLNDLFMFNFNFDKLKQVIIALLSKQNETNNIIAMLSSRIDTIEGNSTQNITTNNDNVQIVKSKPVLPQLHSISNIPSSNTGTMISTLLSSPPLLSNPSNENKNLMGKDFLFSPNIPNDKKIEALASQIENQNQMISKLSTTIEELSSKVADFDIYEIFKDVGKTKEGIK